MPGGNKPRVLFVDDEASLLSGMKRLLRDEYCVETAVGAVEALKLMDEVPSFAVIVSDMRMPNMNGVEFLGTVKARWPEATRVMLTGQSDQETACQAVNVGAIFQFLKKPCSPSEVKKVLVEAVAEHDRRVQERDRLLTSIADTDRLSSELLQEKLFDSLTSLPNRSALEEQLDLASEDRDHCVCVLSLDNFSVVNAVGGKAAGDELLQLIANSLKVKLHEYGVLYRLDGDRFGIHFANLTLDNALAYSSQLVETVRRIDLDWGDLNLSVSVSIGLAQVDNTDPAKSQALIAADVASRLVKEKGGNGIRAAQNDDSDITQRQEEMEWVPKIISALKEDRFRVYAQLIQPLQPTPEKKGIHCEVLIRMCDESGELVSPGLFIPPTERFNLAPDMDRWMIRNTINWLADNPVAERKLSVVSINLSGQSLTDFSMLDYIVNSIKATEIPPHKFCFEVTETSAINCLSHAVKFINQLRAMGCEFALDDFGVGMSSFGYLKTLPVDYVKIDGSFVKEMIDNTVSSTMVRCINEIAQVMGKRTIAEFVENEEISNALRQIGVDYAQGYFVAKPMPIDELFSSQHNSSANGDLPIASGQN